MNITDGKKIITISKKSDQDKIKQLIADNDHEGVSRIVDSYKKGGMLKRADGSYSKRGLWDNIRANKGSGKKPTKQMLEQEAKIRAMEQHGGAVTDWHSGAPVPWHHSTIGETMGKGGYTVKRSSARKGKTHVVIGPDGTKKYFGDSHLGQHPNNPARKKSFYARHKHNLAKNPYFRAFARATWGSGGKLSQNIYDLGIMPYADGGYTFSNMNPDGTIHVPYGYSTPAYNERGQYDLGGWLKKAGNSYLTAMKDTGLAIADTGLSGINQDFIKDSDYSNTGFGKIAKGYSNVVGGISHAAAPMVAGAFGGPAASMAVSAAQQASKQFVKPDQERLQSTTGQVGESVGSTAKIAGSFYNPMSAAEQAPQMESAITQGINTGSPYGRSSLGEGFYGRQGGYVKMANGGQAGMVPINVEGGNFSEGSGPDAKKGELLVLNGKIIKNYVGRPPHPAEGQNPMGDDDAPEGLIVIPKNRTKEYLEASIEKRKQIEKSLVSQQQDREMKKSKQMGDGGYYSFGMGDQGFAYGGVLRGGPNGNPETLRSMEDWGAPSAYKKGGWIQKATASIKRRGTEGVCTGSKFGSSSCPPGSRRYNLAKTFRKMARAKHEDGGTLGFGGSFNQSMFGNMYGEDHTGFQHEMRAMGGFVDPVTGSHNVMYGQGGQLPESLLRTRMRASGASPKDINDYVAAHYADGGETRMPDMNITYKKGGGIYIKPANRGKFTAWAKSHGMGVQEAAQHVMANKDKYSSTIVKRANFAKNAARWKHKEGGPTTHDFPHMGDHGVAYADGGRLRYDENTVTGGNSFVGPPTFEQSFFNSYDANPNAYNQTDPFGNEYSVSPGVAYETFMKTGMPSTVTRTGFYPDNTALNEFLSHYDYNKPPLETLNRRTINQIPIILIGILSCFLYLIIIILLESNHC